VRMKEIDFIPQWYKNNRRRRSVYRIQYIVIMCVFVVMAAWSFMSAAALSDAKAELNQLATGPIADEKMLQDFAETRKELVQLEKNKSVLDQICSRIDVSKVMAEISFLVDKRIILSGLDIKAEKFDDKSNRRKARTGTVRAVKTKTAKPTGLLVDDARFKVVVTGVAVNATDVARLIRRLEDSAYFWQVVPEFSRTKKINDFQATEFKINCYIENYIEEKQRTH